MYGHAPDSRIKWKRWRHNDIPYCISVRLPNTFSQRDCRSAWSFLIVDIDSLRAGPDATNLQAVPFRRQHWSESDLLRPAVYFKAKHAANDRRNGHRFGPD